MKRREFLRSAGGIILPVAAGLVLPSAVRAGLVTQSGPRYAAAVGGGGGGTIFLNDNFASATVTSAISLTSRYTSLGYVDVNITSTYECLNRAGMPAGLLSDGNFPGGKTHVLHSHYGADEDNCRLVWANYPALQMVSWISWWEYRPNNNHAGEKWLRIGNYEDGTRASRHWDFIWCLGGSPDKLTLISNSDGTTFAFGDQTFNTINVSGLHHYEVGVGCSTTSTSTDGWSKVYQDGTLVADVENLRMWNDVDDTTRMLQLTEFGGWTSGSFSTIDRYFCQFKIADTQQGVWALDAA